VGAERPQALAINRSFSQRYQLNSKLLSPLKRGVLGQNKQTRFLPEIRSEYGWRVFSAPSEPLNGFQRLRREGKGVQKERQGAERRKMDGRTCSQRNKKASIR